MVIPEDYQVQIEEALNGDLRPFANQRMTSWVEIGESTLSEPDPNTDQVSEIISVVWEGPARFHYREIIETTPVGGQVERNVMRTMMYVPWDTVGIEVGHTIRVVSSTTPYMVNKTLTVVAIPVRDDATALRIMCQEVEL